MNNKSLQSYFPAMQGNFSRGEKKSYRLITRLAYFLLFSIFLASTSTAQTDCSIQRSVFNTNECNSGTTFGIWISNIGFLQISNSYLTEYSDGTAHLTAQTSIGTANIYFANRSFSSSMPQIVSPCFGAQSTSTWYYYHTLTSGHIGNVNLASLYQGKPFQIGFNANFQGSGYGGAAWLYDTNGNKIDISFYLSGNTDNLNQLNDSDGDGFCDTQDCLPNNPAFPATPGTTCNDGDANTIGDVVLADGCTCEGTPDDPVNPPSDCFSFEGKVAYEAIGNSMSYSEARDNCNKKTNSSASLNIPAGATIERVFLQWSGSGNVDNTVSLNGQTVIATQSYTYSLDAFSNAPFYGAYADVTSLVQASGNYTVSNLAWNNNNPYCFINSAYGAWSMVVVYNLASGDDCAINICHDNFEMTYPAGTYSGSINNLTPSSCTSDAELTLIAFEGDNYKGEYFYIGSQYYGDNLFKGQTAPNLDIATFDVSNLVNQNTSSLSYAFQTYYTNTIWGGATEGLFPFVKVLKYNVCTPANISVGDVTVNEDATEATVIVSIDQASTLPVTVQYTTTNGTATSGDDYTTVTGTVTIPAGQTSATITIPILDDNIEESDETFTVTLSNPQNGTLSNAQSTVTITDNDVIPNISIDDVSVDESAGNGTLTVSIDQASSQPVTVQYTTTNGTATSGDDYTTTTGTITIPAGQTTASITIPILDDNTNEPDETFTVTLSNPENAVITDAQGTVTITDNDDVNPNITVGDVTVDEDDGTAVVQICIDVVSNQNVTVQYSTADASAASGADYTSVSGTATILAGQTCVNITIPILDDNVNESNETFTVNLNNAQNGVITDPQGIVTITDNDDPVNPNITVGDITVNENAGTATVQICINQATNQNITVQYSTADISAASGADYTSVSGTATILAGQTCANVIIPILDDNTNEPNETFTVNLNNPQNGIIADPQGIVTIIDNDDPVNPNITVGDVTVNENAGTATVQICIDQATNQSVTVQYNTADASAASGADYTSVSGTVTIPTGQTCANITIPIVDDTTNEPTETFNVNLSNPNNATIADQQGIVTILDNDNGGGTPDCADIGINTTNGNIVVTGLDGAPITSVQVFTSAWAGVFNCFADCDSPTQTIPATAGDYIVFVKYYDAAYNFICQIQENVTVSGGGGGGNMPNVTINDVTVNEDAGTATLIVSTNQTSNQPVTVQYNTTNGTANAGSDYTTSTGTVTIPAGQTTASITIPIIDNTTNEATETFNVNLSNPTNATIADQQGIVTILDNDNGGGGGNPDCANIGVNTSNGNIIVTGLDGAPITSVQVFTTAWAGVFNCFADCDSPTQTIPAPTGDYLVYVKYYTSSYSLICEVEETVTVGGGGGGGGGGNTPNITINDVTVNENAGTATLTVSTDQTSNQSVTVQYNTTNGTASAGSDYTTSTGTVTIPAGQTTASITIPIVDNTTNEATETFNVNLSNPTNANIADQQGIVTILDNDNGGGGGNGVDLELAINGDGTQVAPYTSFSVDVLVTNTGNATSNNVVVNVPQPQNVVFQGGNASSATEGTYDPYSTFNWSVGSLAPGQSETLTLNYYALAGSPYTVYGQILSAGGADIDSTPGNGTAPTPNEDDEAVYVTDGNGGGSNSCTLNLTSSVTNIVCNDNGTPNNASDDTFKFHLTVSGGNPWGYSGDGINGSYDVPVSYGPYLISNGNVSFVVTDADNTACTTTVNVSPPSTCSNDGGGGATNCDDVIISSGSNSITATGLDNAPVTAFWIFDAAWQTVYDCSYDCNATETVPVSAGTYFVIVKRMNADWSEICKVSQQITVSNFNGDESSLSLITDNGDDSSYINAEEREDNSQEGLNKVFNMTLSPNPANSFVNVSFAYEGEQIVQVNILDRLGRVVEESKTVSNSTLRINTSNLNSGIYFVNARTEQGEFITKQLVILP